MIIDPAMRENSQKRIIASELAIFETCYFEVYQSLELKFQVLWIG